jgi:C1A family cysteine protease
LESTSDALKSALQDDHVVSVSIDADDIMLYESGVILKKDCRYKALNHDIAAVGYKDNYFIIRNSWGPTWGEKGYLRME